MSFNWTNSVLNSSRKNISLAKRLNNLLTENLSIDIDYSKYFNQCAPLVCTYTKTSESNFWDATTLLLSLYGSLTIILRLIAPLLVSLSLKVKCRSQNTNGSCGNF